MSYPTHPSMLPRFEGNDGKERLVEVLKRQVLVAGNDAIAREIVEKAQIIEYLSESTTENIITQGNTDTDIYFIISGTVAVCVNGREIATRSAGSHVGELSLVDQTVRRSATIMAKEPCVCLKVSQTDFSEIAQRSPQLWRIVAVEIGNRLRERSKYIRPPHNQSVLFIGSSSEQLEIARSIQLGLQHDPIVSSVWTDGIFKASRTSIENLMEEVGDADFAVLVVTPDDKVESREVEQASPRDNILFELGLFMGGIGRDRTFIVRPKGVDIKVPADLLGITPLEYVTGEAATLTPRIAPICTELRRLIKELGPK